MSGTALNSFVQVRIEESPSILFRGMAGSTMPIVNSHGEGRVLWYKPEDAAKAFVAARYVDSHGNPTEVYPLNPNGSEGGVTSLTGIRGTWVKIRPGCGCLKTPASGWVKRVIA